MTSAKSFQTGIIVYAAAHGVISTDDVADVCVDELDELLADGTLDKIDDEQYQLSERGKARLESILREESSKKE